jgi:23S rRNA pseudouridine1911/1915/1917 synthase
MAHTFADPPRPDYSRAAAMSRPSAEHAPEASSRLPHVCEVPADLAGERLDRVLAHLLPQHSRSRLAGWIREGRVTVNGAAWSPDRRVHGGERVALDTASDPAPGGPHAAQPMALPIVHEDDDLIVIDKPAGLVVHPGNGHREGTLLNALLAHAPALGALPRAGIVHRLDKDTTGLLVVAKNETAQTALVRALQTRNVKREYLALAHGVVSAGGRVEAAIGRHPTHRTRMAVVARGKPATTHYRVLRRFANATLLECALETGRTHQIRVHLASIGHPLVGDPVYGARRTADPLLAGLPRQALHAARLGLEHPRMHMPMVWESSLPRDFAALLESLG